jgi:hypothetical protein
MARQALTLAGTVIGAAFGVPQLGFAIGSLVGNMVDPVQIQGPKIGDMAVQTSRDGVPRPIVFGTAAVMGNIIDRGEPRIVKKKEKQGKGGPETVTEHVYMTFAIRVCEGPVTSISRVWENEKLVYDVTPGSTISGDAADWLSKVNFYYGDESQLPDPALEVIHGVGSTPAYRGTCYAVWDKKDLTEFGGSIPQYRFEVNGGDFGYDPYAAYVISLLHMDGTNNQTTDFVDEVVGTGTWNYPENLLRAAAAQFGDTGFLQGVGWIGAPEYITAQVGRKVISSWGSESTWAQECWFEYNAGVPSANNFVFLCLNEITGNGPHIEVSNVASGREIILRTVGGSDNTGVAIPLDGQKHFYQMISNGTTVVLALDGVQIGSVTTNAIISAGSAHWCPASNTFLGGNIAAGNFDECRLTKGAARPIDLPTAAFPNP